MENENLKPVEKLTSFTKMCMTIGTLPSSFYASMDYYESMIWLYGYLKNEIIPAINNNSEVTQELQTAFTELETYVQNTIIPTLSSFNERLDTQEERLDTIDEKLDIQDGRLDVQEEKLDVQEERLDNQEETITTLENNLESTQNDLEDTKAELDKYKTIYNVLPKVTGTGETLTLSNTGNSLMELELKGNTSQNGEPTPSSPIPINVVSGDNEVVVCGKNLIPFTNQDFTLNGVRFYVQNGSLFMNGTVTSETLTTHAQFKNNFSFTLPAGTYYFNRGSALTTLSVATRLLKYDDNTTLRENNGTFTLAEDTKVYLGFYLYNKTFNNITTETMLNKGNTQETYEPYQSQTYPINLGELELYKIGDYQDYFTKNSDGQWCKYNAIGKVVLDGSESWTYNSGVLSFYHALTDNLRQDITSNTICKANNLTNYGLTLWQDTSGTIEYGFLINNQYFYIRNINYTDANDLKTWLSSNNVLTYYPLATPYLSLIEDETLIEQLDIIQNAMSYEGTTNIGQVNNDKAFIISAKALQLISGE